MLGLELNIVFNPIESHEKYLIIPSIIVVARWYRITIEIIFSYSYKIYRHMILKE